MVELTASDGHRFAAYAAGAADAARCLVVVQEIFGVNPHMRRVCDGFAEAGFRVLAPALFDRAERGVELGYGAADRDRGLALRAAVPEAGSLADVAACAEALGGRPRGLIGYCWGGTIAWLGATRTTLFAAAVGWYGGGIVRASGEVPACPTQLHFGAEDQGIPLTDVDAIRAARPDVEVFVYPDAGHGFGCEDRASYHPAAAALAQERSLTFLRQHL